MRPHHLLLNLFHGLITGTRLACLDEGKGGLLLLMRLLGAWLKPMQQGCPITQPLGRIMAFERMGINHGLPAGIVQVRGTSGQGLHSRLSKWLHRAMDLFQLLQLRPGLFQLCLGFSERGCRQAQLNLHS